MGFRVNLFASNQSQTLISSSLTTDSNNGNDLSLYKRLVSSAKRKNSYLLEEAEISLTYNKNNSGLRTDPWGTPH